MTENDRDNLVAYLDGELPELEAAALEAKLNADPQARAEADTLKRTWQMLDLLPKSEPSPAFTHKTLERVTVQVSPLPQARPPTRWRPWVAGLGWAATVLLFTAAGFAGGQMLFQRATLPVKASPDPEPTQAVISPVIEPKRSEEKLDESQWIARLPKAYRDQIQRAPGDKRSALVKQFRQEEQDRAKEWQVALRRWDQSLAKKDAGPRTTQHSLLADFPPEVQIYVNEHLKPRLTKQDSDRLTAAAGRFPLFPKTLVELADKYPQWLPGPALGPTRFQELPEAVRKQLEKLPPAKRNLLRANEGAWPEYAMKVAAVARNNQIRLAKQLGPSNAGEFSSAVHAFIRYKLEPVLEPQEQTRLKTAQGHWPGYPQTLLELARAHKLQVPEMSLPGNPEVWDKFRTMK